MKIKKIVDLTLPFEEDENLPEHGVRYGYYLRKQILTLPKDRFRCYQIGFWNHWGTHVDSPSHIFYPEEHPGQYWLHDIPLERWISPAICLPIPKGPLGEITGDDFEKALKKTGLKIQEGDIVCANTGWLNMKDCYGPERKDGPLYMAPNNPGLSPNGADWLVDTTKHPRLNGYGCDTMGVNCAAYILPASDEHRKAGKPIIEWKEPTHYTLLKNDLLQVECMTNLDQVAGKRFTLVALPLRLLNIDACPVRAVGILED